MLHTVGMRQEAVGERRWFILVAPAADPEAGGMHMVSTDSPLQVLDTRGNKSCVPGISNPRIPVGEFVNGTYKDDLWLDDPSPPAGWDPLPPFSYTAVN